MKTRISPNKNTLIILPDLLDVVFLLRTEDGGIRREKRKNDFGTNWKYKVVKNYGAVPVQRDAESFIDLWDVIGSDGNIDGWIALTGEESDGAIERPQIVKGQFSLAKPRWSQTPEHYCLPVRPITLQS